MGNIRNTSTNATRVLEPEHVVGRAPNCSLRIVEGYVSSQHAVLRWMGDHWNIKDLGSRNGTFVDGVRIQAGQEHELCTGTKLYFGKPEQQWEVLDDSAPIVMAIAVDRGYAVLIDGELLVLPSSENPLVTIYPHSDGGWLLEQPNEATSRIAHMQTFEAAGQLWRFCCPELQLKTAPVDFPLAMEVRHIELSFWVSRDEEHVQLHASCETERFDLGSRVHNYLLLILARKRLEDAIAGQPDTSCGWMYIEDLIYGPQVTSASINIDVFRIRKQFDTIGVLDPANIIERRPRTKQLRIGTKRISVRQL